MAANLQPITSDGGFTSGGNINSSGDPSSAPSLNDFFSITSAANFAIVTDNANTDQTWTFDDTGNLTLPLGSIVYETNIPDQSLSGSAIALKPIGGTTANQQLLIYPTANDGDHVHMTSGNLYATELFLGSDNFYVKLANTGNVVINSNDGNSSNAMWTFDTDGNLTLPGNTFAVNYANGTQVSISGGNANTGNVTFSDQVVIGTGSNDGSGGLYLAPGNNSIANSAVQYLRVRGGDVVTHIHLDTGNNAFYDQYFGDDAKYVKLELGDTGNVVIGTDDANGNQYNWSFTSDGNLILADGNSIITSIANSSLDPNNANVSTMVFTPDQNYTSQSLVIDPTGPSHIHLRAPGANIDEPDANIFLGGETSSFEVGYYNGAAPNLFIHSNNNTWTFDTAGTLVFPRDTGPNTTDPILTIVGGANPSISAIDASLAGPANLGISALTTIFSGFTGDEIKIYPDDGEISSTANLQIWANSGGNTEYSWTFDTTGNLTTPSNLVIGPGPGSGSSIFQYNEGLQILGEGANSVVQLGWTANTSAPDSVTTIAMNYPGGGEGNVLIAVGNNATTVNYWLFDNTGNLRLPGNTFAVNYANGTQVSLGGGNVTWAQIDDKSGNSGPTIITLGQNAGLDGQGNAAIAIGKNAGQGGQGASSITIGEDAGGNTTQGANSVAIGRSAGFDAQGIGAVAIGSGAGSNSQGNQSVAIGENAGVIQGSTAVAIGQNAGGGLALQGDDAVAIGHSAGSNAQGTQAVAIGLYAGQTTQGTNSIAIGANAGITSQGNNSIILNATGANLNQTVANTFTVSPVRNDTSNIAEVMFYNATSKEVTYGNTISVAGNITGAYVLGNGSGLTSLPAPTVAQDITSNGAMSIMTYDGNLKYVNYATVEPSTGNIAGGNISTTGTVTANTAIITTGNITTINSGLLQNGNSNITITSNGNVSIQAAGSNVELVVTSTGANVTGTLTSTGKIGYASGSTVTQTTNRGNGVTINALAGTIITTSASMVANQIDTFSVANDQVDPNNDIVLVQIVSPNFGVYNCIAQPSATISSFLNGFYINIQNISGFTTTSDAITIRFMVIKAPNA
jgi:hypothetical protein